MLLDVEIGSDGKPDLLKVRRSLGLGLDEKAIDCVKQWRFKSAYKGGKPVSTTAIVEVNFRL